MIAFSIGPIDIHRYGIFYLIGFLGGYFFLRFLGKTKLFSNFPKLQKVLDSQLEDILIFLILGVLIGGRIGHVIIYDLQYFSQHPLDILKIRQGGMSFIGGMIGSLLALIIFKQKNKLSGIEFRLLLDCIVAIVPLGIALGRFGNFLNQELYGIVVADDFRGLGSQTVAFLKQIHLFHIYPNIDDNLRVNANFLAIFGEGILNLIVLMILTFKRIKKKIFKPGFLVGIFLLIYSGTRFIFEYIRQESQTEFIGPFSKSQRFFVLFIIIGLYFVFRKNKISNNSLKKAE